MTVPHTSRRDGRDGRDLGVEEYDVDCAACKLLGHKWTSQIVVVLLTGPHRFSALRHAIPNLSEKVLSGRLAELEAAGIVSRTHYPEIPPRVEYTLTPAGFALEPIIAAMDTWSRQHPISDQH